LRLTISAIAFLAFNLSAGLSSAQELEGNFYPDKDTYMIGEPLFFTTEIQNKSANPAYLWPHKPGQCLDLYTFFVHGPQIACGNKWDNVCESEPLLLKPGETYHERWPLDHWYRLSREGEYEVTISHKLYVSSAITGIQDFTFSSTFKVNLIPEDKESIERALRKFERDLNSTDPEIEHAALDTMATTAPSFFLQEALRLAHDKDPFRVLHAIGALRQMNVPQGRAVLADIITGRELANHDEVEVRFHAIQALAESSDISYLSLVQRYMEDKVNDIQLESMIAVAQLGKETTTPELQRFLLSPDVTTRKNAAYALRFAMNGRAVEALIGALQDSDPAVRTRVVTSLQEMTGRSESQSNSPAEIQERWRKWWRAQGTKTQLIAPAPFVCRQD
jgi:hypothetical protein